MLEILIEEQLRILIYKMVKGICSRGHDTRITGRDKCGSCKVCRHDHYAQTYVPKGPNRKKKLYCKYGHEIAVVGRYASGAFGFGGKYWSERNAVTYYQEDYTEELSKLETKVNILLGGIE